MLDIGDWEFCVLTGLQQSRRWGDSFLADKATAEHGFAPGATTRLMAPPTLAPKGADAIEAAPKGDIARPLRDGWTARRRLRFIRRMEN